MRLWRCCHSQPLHWLLANIFTKFRIHTLFHIMVDRFQPDHVNQLDLRSLMYIQLTQPQWSCCFFILCLCKSKIYLIIFVVYKLGNIAHYLGSLTFIVLGWSYAKVSLMSSSIFLGNNWKKLLGFPDMWSGIFKRLRRQFLMLSRKQTSKAYNLAGQRKIYSLSGHWYWLTL